MSLKPHPQIWKAIKQRGMMRLLYDGKVRIIEAHDHGILNVSDQLLAWQVVGFSSRPLPNWLLMKVDEMVELTTLPDKFSGGRPTRSGEHIKWDKLFIRVQPLMKAPTPAQCKRSNHAWLFDSRPLTQLSRKLAEFRLLLANILRVSC